MAIDLRTESPKPRAIQRAAERLLREPQWRQNAARLRTELNSYHPYDLIDAYLAKVDCPIDRPTRRRTTVGADCVRP